MTELTPDAAKKNAQMRSHMVDSQVRPNQVNDARIIAAMRALPREAFAPQGSRPYADADIPLGNNRFMLAPLTIAKLCQLTLANNPKTILVIAANTGYGATLLAYTGAHVTTLESDKSLDTTALATYGENIRRLTGPLPAGDPASAPYDAILIEGAIPQIPTNLAPQLTPTGRLITIISPTSNRPTLAQAVIAEKSGAAFATIPKFDVTGRTIPAFSTAPAFIF